MVNFAAIRAPSSYGRVKSEIFHLGVASYLRSARSRKVFDALGSGIGQVALCFNPNYRAGEMREAINRELKLGEFKPGAIASDLKFNQPLEQEGITENMRHSLAWKFITQNISAEKTTFFLAKNAMAGILAAFAWVSSCPLFLLGAGLFAGRAVSDRIRSSSQRNLGLRYLTADPFSKIRLMQDYFFLKESWPEKLRLRFITSLGEFDAELAAYLGGEINGN